MIKLLDPNKLHDYVPICEEGETKPFTLKLQYPGLRLMEKIENDSIELVTQDNKSVHKIKSGTQKVVLLLNGVKGWENAPDGLTFNAEAPETSLDFLPVALRDELVAKLRGNEDVLNDIRDKHAKKQAKLLE